jgi:hypothetical protein
LRILTIFKLDREPNLLWGLGPLRPTTFQPWRPERSRPEGWGNRPKPAPDLAEPQPVAGLSQARCSPSMNGSLPRCGYPAAMSPRP